MKPHQHLLISVIAASLLYALTRNGVQAFILCCTGVVIDADHFFDYYMNYKGFARLQHMYVALEHVRLRKIYLLLHSYELAFIMWWTIIATGAHPLWVAGGLGISLHLICDQIGNREIRPLAYFLIYRIYHHFDKNALIDPVKLRQ